MQLILVYSGANLQYNSRSVSKAARLQTQRNAGTHRHNLCSSFKRKVFPRKSSDPSRRRAAARGTMTPPHPDGAEKLVFYREVLSETPG